MTPLPQTVLVTGASRGIGLEIVRQYAKLENGPKYIFAAARKPNEAKDLQTLKTDHSSSVHLIELDVEDDNSIKSAYESVCKILPKDTGLNVLINNAGIMDKEGSGFPDAERKAYQYHMNVNITGAVMVTQTFLPLLKLAAQSSNSAESGVHKAAIIHLSSGLGSIGNNTTGTKMCKNLPYRLTKAALNQFSKTLAIDLADTGIIAVSFCPGWVQTDMGGPNAHQKVHESVETLLTTMHKLDKSNSGAYLQHTGETLPY